jgi:tRNA threonylcarbamoyladenosine modification (KEOPS) complex Cgi121 subunit
LLTDFTKDAPKLGIRWWPAGQNIGRAFDKEILRRLV